SGYCSLSRRIVPPHPISMSSGWQPRHKICKAPFDNPSKLSLIIGVGIKCGLHNRSAVKVGKVKNSGPVVRCLELRTHTTIHLGLRERIATRNLSCHCSSVPARGVAVSTARPFPAVLVENPTIY